MHTNHELIFRTAPVGLALLDLDLRFVAVNDRLAELNGMPVAQHIGRSVRELLPSLADQAAQALEHVLRTGETLRDFEVVGQTPAQPGVKRVWREQFTPVRDAAGAIVGMGVVAEEITQQRAAEEALRRSEEKLSLAMEAGGLVPWDWYIAEDKVNFGAAWEAALGYPPNSVASSLHGWRSLVHPEDLPRVFERIDDHLRRRTPVFECEYRARTADGHWRWFASRGRVVERDAQGKALRMVGVRRDVTEAIEAREALQQRERELRHSQERLQIALDAGRMGVWDWRPGSSQAYWSAEVLKLVGLPPHETDQGQAGQLLQMVHPEDQGRIDAEVARVLSKGGDYEVEFRVLRADGETRWLVSRGRVLHDDVGQRSRMVGVNFDITERKLNEQALLEADARRTEFLAMLAHELRNPLAPIVNAVRLLERVGDMQDRREAATRILKRQSAHMARLVDDLLEVSRITQGRIELRTENVLVATSVFQAVEAARPQARERSQSITVDVPPLLDLVADPARLTQIVSNLVTNAVKYTPEHGAIEVTARADGEDWLEIAVRDNGVGISPELLPRLFELFTQDRRTLDRAEGGLGIGLALVKRLAELHGGSVRCESAGAGLGAAFVVRLPRRGRREQLRGSMVTATMAHVPQLPMLVVDDNRDAADSLAALLRLDGHRIEEAFDGEQALHIAREFVPRVVLLDLGLPKLDGLSVARALRRDPRLRDVVLIAMSGYAQTGDREATDSAGFDAHLAKPVELADIYRAIEARLG